MKAFIFDFDGVIVDSELYWDKLCLPTYQTFVPSFTEEDDRKLKGRNINDIYQMLVRDFQVTFSKEEYLGYLESMTNDIYGELAQLLPGIRELVTTLQTWNIPTAIASSGERRWIEHSLERLNMANTFSPIITAADVGIGKPDPAVYLETARQMGISPADCVALEDSTNGALSAKAAGMYCIGLHHKEGYSQDLEMTDMQISSINELTEEILKRL